MEETAVVVACLTGAGRKLTTDQIAAAAGLDLATVDRALQRLLLARRVLCDSYDPPGRGGQAARFIGSHALPLWSLSADGE